MCEVKRNKDFKNIINCKCAFKNAKDTTLFVYNVVIIIISVAPTAFRNYSFKFCSFPCDSVHPSKAFFKKSIIVNKISPINYNTNSDLCLLYKRTKI